MFRNKFAPKAKELNREVTRESFAQVFASLKFSKEKGERIAERLKQMAASATEPNKTLQRTGPQRQGYRKLRKTEAGH